MGSARAAVGVRGATAQHQRVPGLKKRKMNKQIDPGIRVSLVTFVKYILEEKYLS